MDVTQLKMLHNAKVISEIKKVFLLIGNTRWMKLTLFVFFP